MTHLQLRYPLTRLVYGALFIALGLHLILAIFYGPNNIHPSWLFGFALTFDVLFLIGVFLLDVQEHVKTTTGHKCHFCGTTKDLIERSASKAEHKAFHLDTILECPQCHEVYEEV